MIPIRAESGDWSDIRQSIAPVEDPAGTGAGLHRFGGDSAQLCLVPLSQFEQLEKLEISRELRAMLFATLCRLNTLYMITLAGSGHIGTCFSSMDIFAWLYLNELESLEPADPTASDIVFSSKGHDAPAQYAALMGLGLLDFENIHRLRQLGGLPGHPHIETPYVFANTGSLGMGISKAKGMVIANRLAGRRHKVFVITGDGELQEGQLWESLATAAHRGLDELIAIVDHNKVQSDTWVREVNDVGDIEAKFASFGWHVERCNGHDFVAFGAAFERMRDVVGVPKVLIADTCKGKGVSFMEAQAMKPGELYRYHSGAPSQEEYGAAIEELLERAERLGADAGIEALELDWCDRRAHVKHTGFGNIHRLVSAYEDELVKQAERNPRIVVLDADLIKDCGLIAFQKRFPDRFIECGIAEQDMVSQAGGLAQMGMIPIAHSFACFLSARPNEQIYNNATQRRKVIYAGSLAGILPGGPGHSHQSVRDISILASTPGLVLIEPCCEGEVRQALEYAINGTEESTYIRLCSMGWDMPFTLPTNYRLREGCGLVVRKGSDGAVIAYGPWLLSNAYEAAEALAERRGIQLRVINLPWLNRVRDDWLLEALEGCSWIFTLDNHYEAGGQGQMLLSHLAELNSAVSEARMSGGGVAVRPELAAETMSWSIPRAQMIGLTEIPECGGTDEVLRHHCLDSESLAERMADVMGVGTAR